VAFFDLLAVNGLPPEKITVLTFDEQRILILKGLRRYLALYNASLRTQHPIQISSWTQLQRTYYIPTKGTLQRTDGITSQAEEENTQLTEKITVLTFDGQRKLILKGLKKVPCLVSCVTPNAYDSS
jgi:hypothetical protein